MGGPEIVAIADDLTGALEAGAKFSGHGLASVVLTGGKTPGPGDGSKALVYDIETRHVSASEAYRRVVALREEFALRPDAIRYKKTDSTLRGNICAELQAFASLHSGSSIVYCPAYPAMGRTVREGHLYVDGVPLNDTSFRDDRLNPVGNSCVPSLFDTGCTLPVRTVRPDDLALSSGATLLICDGESDTDVDAAARFIVAHYSRVIAAGPASLAGSLAALMPGNKKEANWPALRTCHVANGSLHPASAAQIAWAESNGFANSGWTVFHHKTKTQGLERAMALGQQLSDLIGDTGVDAVLIFGGDTAFGLAAALGHPRLEPLGEPVPGVALSRVAAEELAVALPGCRRALFLLTKAGGFGSPDLIMQLRRVLR